MVLNKKMIVIVSTGLVVGFMVLAGLHATLDAQNSTDITTLSVPDPNYKFPKGCYVFGDVDISNKTEKEVIKILETERDKRIPKELLLQLGDYTTKIDMSNVKINKSNTDDYVNILKRYADMKVINEYKDITLISLVHIDYDSLKEKVLSIATRNNITIDKDEFNNYFLDSFFSDDILNKGIIIPEKCIINK